MNIKEMHYDFKIKRNKIDSQQYRNLLVPEIDWLLNSAIEVFVKMTMNPRYNPIPGFEKTQRDRDDLKNLVINNYIINHSSSNNNEYVYELPSDYIFYISANISMYKEYCGIKQGRAMVRQHDDEFQLSPFDKSSYEWGEVNVVFNNQGIKAFADNSFDLRELKLNYLQQHPYIHNAEDFTNNTYTTLEGLVLTGTQDCILSEHTHSEIVDVAVLLATQNLQIPDYQVIMNKLKLT